MLLAFQVARAGLLVAGKRAEGAGGYATAAWQQSPMVTWSSASPPPPGSMTNGADVLFLATGRRYPWVPRVDDLAAIEAIEASSRRGDSVSVVWFDGIDWRGYLISRDALLGLAEFEVVHDTADGAMYTSRGR